MQFGISFEFEKADTTGRFVRGWASVVSDAGQVVEDHQGDVISIDEIRKAAHRFICDARVAKAMHSGSKVGEVVESVIIDDAFAKALGLTDSKRGWWIGMEITDPEIQKQVRKGTLRAFSIGGRGRRTKMEA